MSDPPFVVDLHAHFPMHLRGHHEAVPVRARLGVLLLVAACGARTDPGSRALEPDDAGPDASVHDAGRDATRDAPQDSPPDPLVDASGPAMCVVADAGGPPFPDACGMSAKMTSFTPSSSTCFVDVAVKLGEAGALTFFCQGGHASANFGHGEFLGNYTGKTFDVCIGTTFSYSDGCTWKSAQRITGDPASGHLAFSYEEAPVGGTSCASPCSATGVITLGP